MRRPPWTAARLGGARMAALAACTLLALALGAAGDLTPDNCIISMPVTGTTIGADVKLRYSRPFTKKGKTKNLKWIAAINGKGGTGSAAATGNIPASFPPIGNCTAADITGAIQSGSLSQVSVGVVGNINYRMYVADINNKRTKGKSGGNGNYLDAGYTIQGLVLELASSGPVSVKNKGGKKFPVQVKLAAGTLTVDADYRKQKTSGSAAFSFDLSRASVAKSSDCTMAVATSSQAFTLDCKNLKISLGQLTGSGGSNATAGDSMQVDLQLSSKSLQASANVQIVTRVNGCKDACNRINGSCVKATSGSFSCQCNAGFQGDGITCTQQSISCTPPCQNGGRCVAQNQCDCTGTGYTGPTCGTGNSTTSCPEGSSRNGDPTASCDWALPGYYATGTGQPPQMARCPVNTYAGTIRQISQGQAPASSCQACPQNLNTNGTNGQANCSYVDAGYYWDATLAAPQTCPIDTAAPAPRLISNAATAECDGCPANMNTHGAFGQVTCTWVDAGYYYDAALQQAKACPVDTSSAAARPIASATQCVACPAHLTTNSTTAQKSCAFVSAGYYYESGQPKPCPVDTFSPAPRPVGQAPACTACTPPLTTNNLTGQAQCGTSTILPGFYWDAAAGQAKPCQPGFFNPNSRKLGVDADATFCYSCSNLINMRERNPITGEAHGLVAESASTVLCSCPPGTFLSYDTDASTGAQSNWACVACPIGTTSGASGAAGIEACRAKCQAGYWGDPSTGYGYGGQCRVCPTVAPGDAPSSRLTDLAAPAPQTSCSACSAGSYLTGGQASPAACTGCPEGRAPSGAADTACGYCQAGYGGDSCISCSLLGNYPEVTTALAGPPSSAASNCGGCLGGYMGPDCTVQCPSYKMGSGPKAAPVNGASFVTILFPTQDDSNCLWGCPPGTGYDAATDSCVPCGAGMYSPGASKINPWPLCLKCPGSTVPDNAARCIPPSAAKAAADAAAAAAGSGQPGSMPAVESALFDDFD